MRTKRMEPYREQRSRLTSTDAFEMGLVEYRRKRDFKKTSEPSGDTVATRRRGAGTLRFVVQKHAASRLHYDFRLELDGVLKSWAVPKGPSLTAGERRLAAQTEDHPMDYADFEGVIPAGEYGGGAVIVWDRGTWAPIGDARAGLEKGDLSFVLSGEKLRGRWHLARMKSRSGDRGKSEWLLIKGRDGEARAATAAPIVESAPNSVLSGRDIADVKESPGRVWSSKHGERNAPKIAASGDPARLPGARKGRLADHNGPQNVAGVRLSSPDRVYYPDDGVTKRDLAEYWESVADRALPFLAHRPLSMLRCPETIAECFYQKRVSESIPAGVSRVVVKEGREPYAMIEDLRSLISLVQVGVIEFHVWGARADRLDRPDMIVFDLDPDPDLPWRSTADTALLLRELLNELGLVAFLRTTGGKGLHVVTPIERRTTWEEVKEFSHALARQFVRTAPDRFTTTVTKSKRKGKILIDYLRNDPESTAIGSWSPRARAGAPIAAPLAWKELDADARPQITVRDASARLKMRDPWAEFESSRRTLTRTMQRRVGSAA
jgi:bifunctional non-homologous end joining protein LigD